jgi:hypothetical protein
MLMTMSMLIATTSMEITEISKCTPRNSTWWHKLRRQASELDDPKFQKAFPFRRFRLPYEQYRGACK